MSFEKLKLIKSIQLALSEEGYKIPTPIERQTIPGLETRYSWMCLDWNR